jgi:hypothetical protein
MLRMITTDLNFGILSMRQSVRFVEIVKIEQKLGFPAGRLSNQIQPTPMASWN